MSYEKPLTVKDVHDLIVHNKLVLPAIQRQFVWYAWQVENLFDSLLQGYPISSFIFWQVPKHCTNNMKFYELLKKYSEYDELSTQNRLAAVDAVSTDVKAVLDGQQRLTALFIGLSGTYAYKLPYARWKNKDSFPERTLYLNLLSKKEVQRDDSSDSEGRVYDFVFLSEQDRQDEQYKNWMNVQDIVREFNGEEGAELEDKFNRYLKENCLITETSGITTEQAAFAHETLKKLYDAVYKTQAINYFYLDDSTSLNDVVEIFIRCNSGGTILSYSDFFFSMMVANWEKKDARKEILGLRDHLAGVGHRFDSLDKDFIIKAGLVLEDIQNIKIDAANLTIANCLKIENDWEMLSKCLKRAFELVADFGFWNQVVCSFNMFIPIAYFFKVYGPDEELTEEDRTNIRKWLVATTLKNTFKYTPDRVLLTMREVLQANHSCFPLEKIAEALDEQGYNITFTDEEVDELKWVEYYTPQSMAILSLLYKHHDFRQYFDMDHIHPKSYFYENTLREYGITDFNDCYDRYNCIGNLQLLDSKDNLNKSDKLFVDWLKEKYKDMPAKYLNDYLSWSYLPATDMSECESVLAFENFLDFYEKRFALIKEQLIQELGELYVGKANE